MSGFKYDCHQSLIAFKNFKQINEKILKAKTAFETLENRLNLMKRGIFAYQSRANEAQKKHLQELQQKVELDFSKMKNLILNGKHEQFLQEVELAGIHPTGYRILRDHLNEAFELITTLQKDRGPIENKPILRKQNI